MAKTLTITVSDNEAQRISRAYGASLELGRDATLEEVRAEHRRIMVETVQIEERKAKRAQALANVQEPDPISPQ